MAENKQKRFWKDAAAVADGDGFGVALDGRPVRTPARAALRLPSRALAEMVASEWAAQGERVDPAMMPATRMANAAIDKVCVQHDEVADLLAEYGGTDLLCYRAEGPAGLVSRQAEEWDPPLDWARSELGVELAVGTGIMHVPQDPAHLRALSDRVHALNAFQLAAFHDLVSLSGSLVLAFATTAGWRPADVIWDISRLDDLWQQEQWGEDEEAAELAEAKRQAFLQADRFFKKC